MRQRIINFCLTTTLRTFLLLHIQPLLLAFMITSCNNSTPPKPKPDPKQFKQALEKVNRYEVEKESDEIKQYIARHNWKMEKTGTGLWYMVINPGTGAQPKSGDIVLVNYTISLLDGTICYSSKQDGLKDFKVGGDNVESGLHEAVMMMHTGEKAKFVLPSYMANGMRGDENKIPPLSSLIVDLELVSIK